MAKAKKKRVSKEIDKLWRTAKYWEWLRLVEQEGLVQAQSARWQEAWHHLCRWALRLPGHLEGFWPRLAELKHIPDTPDMVLLRQLKDFLEDEEGRPAIAALTGLSPAAQLLREKLLSWSWEPVQENKIGRCIKILINQPEKVTGRTFTELGTLLALTPLGLGPKALPLVKQSDSPDPERVRVPLELLRAALGEPGRLTAFEVFLQDAGKAEELRDAVARLAGPQARVLTAADLNAPLFLALGLEKWLMFAGTGLVLLVAFLQLHQSFELLILHSRATWATLLALGAGDAPIRRVFFMVALAIAAAGGLAGGTLAYALGALQNRLHFIPLPAAMAHLGHVPLLFSPWTTLTLGVLLLVLSAVTAFPAGKRAAAVPIVETLYDPQ